MQLSFNYDKKKVIQALRYHFISRPEIKIMMILTNVFAITAAALFYFKKIRPEPFFLGTIIWLMMLLAVWYFLPYTIYRKSPTFKDDFIIDFSDTHVHLENEKGAVNWEWKKFASWLETPNFFHLYFNPKSFFLIPKDEMTDDFRHSLRGMLNTNIGKQK
jgi:hypothetical protein